MLQRHRSRTPAAHKGERGLHRSGPGVRRATVQARSARMHQRRRRRDGERARKGKVGGSAKGKGGRSCRRFQACAHRVGGGSPLIHRRWLDMRLRRPSTSPALRLLPHLACLFPVLLPAPLPVAIAVSLPAALLLPLSAALRLPRVASRALARGRPVAAALPVAAPAAAATWPAPPSG